MGKKGYWLAQFEVTDPEAFNAYRAAVEKILQQYGARFLIRGGRSHADEAQSAARIVLIEFADYKTALRCYLSPEYEQAKVLHEGKAVGHVVVIEGYDGPQPSDQQPSF